MPNNITILDSSAVVKTIATQDTGTEHQQKIRAMLYSSDGTTAIATLPVSVASVPSHAVTNAGTFAAQIDGAALTALQLIDDVVYAEDIAAQAADKGIAILAVRRDADTTLVGTDNDYANLQVNAAGSLKVAITAGAGSGGTSIADEATFTTGTTSTTPIAAIYNSTPDTLTTGKAGALQMTAARALHVFPVDAAGAPVTSSSDYTHDGAMTPSTTAGPMNVFRATNTNPAAVSAADDAALGLSDLTGRQIFILDAPPEKTWVYAAASGGLVNTTAVTVKAAVASTRNYIRSGTIQNAHATVGTEVLIRDGSAGTVIHRGYAYPAGGGYQVKNLRSTSNTLLEVVCVTTGSAVYANFQGFESAI